MMRQSPFEGIVLVALVTLRRKRLWVVCLSGALFATYVASSLEPSTVRMGDPYVVWMVLGCIFDSCRQRVSNRRNAHAQRSKDSRAHRKPSSHRTGSEI
jgi:hypothetical protein